jgi:hypothetical protein
LGLITELVKHMYDVEWFSNRNTHGTYVAVDFVDDLERMSVDELCALRRYQMEDLDDEIFYDKVWNGETITYRKLA